MRCGWVGGGSPNGKAAFAGRQREPCKKVASALLLLQRLVIAELLDPHPWQILLKAASERVTLFEHWHLQISEKGGARAQNVAIELVVSMRTGGRAGGVCGWGWLE